MKQGWEYKTFGEVFELQMGKTPDRKNREYFSGENTWLSIKDLNSKYVSESSEMISDAAAADIKIVPKDTVLMSFKLSIGKCAIAAKDLYTNEAIMAFINKGKYTINNLFLYYYLKGYRWGLANKAVMGLTLNKATISAHKISIPPLSEQEQIVAELDGLNELVAIKKQQLADYDALAQSLFYEMFGDPVSNEKGWEVKKLGEVGCCISGGTPSRKNSEYFRGNINWYSAGELNSLFLSESVEKITSNALNNSSAKLCKPYSLFIGMYDTAAFKLGITKKEATSNQACANIYPDKDNIIWLYFNLLLMRDEALKHRHGIRQKNLNLGFIKEFPIPLPPLPLQQAFAERIEAIEAQKQRVKAAIADLETLLASRMQYWFD